MSTLIEEILDRKFRKRLRRMKEDSEKYVWVLKQIAATPDDIEKARRKLRDDFGFSPAQIDAAARR
jgi:hypothetical protein